MSSLLRQSHARRLFGALAQSRLGTGAAYVALLLVAYHRLRSPWAVSLVLLADFLPGIALSPLCGALADRYSRRALVVGADLLSAAAFVALATTDSYLATVGLALAAGVGTALSGPTLSASLYDLFGAEHRAAASALRSTLMSVGITLGPALAAGLMLLVSPSFVLAINGATFAVSAAVIATVDLGRAPVAPDEPRGSLLSEVQAGVRVTRRTSGLVALLGLDGATVLAAGVINVAEPIYATSAVHGGSTGYALLVSLYGAGMVAGSWCSARLGTDVTTLRRWWLIGLALDAATLGATAAAPDLWIALCTFALTGAGNALVFLQGRIVQEITPPAVLGRVFGLRSFTANVAFCASFLAAGGLIAALGSRWVFALAGLAMLGVALVGASRVSLRTGLAAGAEETAPTAVTAPTTVGQAGVSDGLS